MAATKKPLLVLTCTPGAGHINPIKTLAKVLENHGVHKKFLDSTNDLFINRLLSWMATKSQPFLPAIIRAFSRSSGAAMSPFKATETTGMRSATRNGQIGQRYPPGRSSSPIPWSTASSGSYRTSLPQSKGPSVRSRRRSPEDLLCS